MAHADTARRLANGPYVNRLESISSFPEAAVLPKIELTRRELCDLELIAVGGFAPLDGFLKAGDFRSVVENKRLANGAPWTIPISLSVSYDLGRQIKEQAALTYANKIVGVIGVEEKFRFDNETEAKLVYGTTDTKHPGVAATLARKPVLLGGAVHVFELIASKEFEPTLLPTQTRAIFAELGWRRVAAFQTRNPIHRAHEYLIKTALEVTDGVLINPLVGETKSDDIPADVRIRAYKALLEKYFPKNRAILSLLPASMRYAGPREAIHHAIIRRNYGATHFIVGRDHAGVGNFYGPFDAQKIFEEFKPGELGISPIFFDNSFYCKVCGSLATSKTDPHGPESHLSLSGTQVRKLLAEGSELPPEFTRPEVAHILREYYSGLGKEN